MITLYTFGPAFGLPDPSPFVMKAEMLLKLSGLPHETNTKGFGKAPKGKLPYIDDDGERVADSTFIRLHFEKKYGIDFDHGLSPEQRGAAWALEKMAEDHLYWTLVHARWMVDANFAKGPAAFFNRVPSIVRPVIVAVVRRKVGQSLKTHGIGRHTRAEIATLGLRAVAAMADYLGDKPYFAGEAPAGVDATMFAFTAGALCPTFELPIRTAAESYRNLKDYVGRMTGRFYPDWKEIAGCKAAA